VIWRVISLRVRVRNVRGRGLVSGGGAWLLVQGGEPLPTTRAEKAIVAHFDEAFGQDVLEEAADKLLSRDACPGRDT